MLEKIKTALRISHDKLDDDIQADIDACLADLAVCGVIYADTATDPLVFNAVKLWCRSVYTDDTAKGAEYLRRYDSLKSCLMMAEGYAYPANGQPGVTSAATKIRLLDEETDTEYNIFVADGKLTMEADADE